MLTVIDFPSSGPARELGGEAYDAPPDGVLRWIDVQAPTRDVLERLRGPFGLHPLAIEDCLTFEQRPKIEEYPGHLFVVVHELSSDAEALLEQEIHAFLGPNFLVTVHAGACARIRQVAERVREDRSIHARGIGFVYYLLADAVASRNSDVVDALADSIDTVEEQALRVTSRDALTRVFRLKRALSSARRALAPQRDLFATLARLERSVVNERLALYFRDVYDRIERSVETIEVTRELLSNVIDAHFSIVGQRTNEIMKRLTILSAIFLPLTFITGFFGQNFHDLPFHSSALMGSAIALCVLLPPGMLYWFRRKGWL